MDRWRTWREAMTESLYGDAGFYRGPGTPARHFRTAAHTGATWAAAIRSLVEAVDDALGAPPDFTVVDIGAGGGELLTELAVGARPHWTMVGVDVANRPSGLNPRLAWQRQFPDDVRGVVLAIELLDVVPVDVVELTADGPRVVTVADDGVEQLGEPATLEDREWIARWWPLRTTGDRAELGSPREQLWQTITAGVRAGLALAVDYAANPVEQLSGTLAGYRDGRHRQPVPDGSMDLTAHVLFEALARDGDLLVSQREALRRLGVTAGAPTYRNDPAAYLVDLERATEAAELLNPHGLGGFGWLLHPVGIKLPPAFTQAPNSTHGT